MNKNALTKTPVVCTLAILCCILWGSATPSIKIGYELFKIAILPHRYCLQECGLCLPAF